MLADDRFPNRWAIVVVWSLGWVAVQPASAQEAARGSASPGERPNRAVVVAQIDELVRKGWERDGLEPSPRASDEEWVRRVYLDLTGRIPSTDEVLAFLRDKSDRKRERLVDDLLGSPEFSRHLATIWRVALVGRQNQDRRRVNSDALETWLRQQFDDQVPWDQTTRELITATGNNAVNGATNFTLAHMQDDAVNLTSYTTRLFLGQQIQCIQCHDHPYNNWKQSQFWSINAFFKGVRAQAVRRPRSDGDDEVVSYDLVDIPTTAYATYENRNATVDVAFPVFLDGQKIAGGPEVNRRVELAKFITAADNEAFAHAFVNRVWGQLLGRGIVDPIDDFGPHNPPVNPELLERLATGFQQSGYDIQALYGWIALSEPYQLTSAMTKANATDDALFSRMALKPMSPEQLFDSILVASLADTAGNPAGAETRRRAWLNLFTFTFGNDDGEETETFQGTIPQALLMMNGEIMDRAISTEPGGFLANVIAKSMTQPSRPDAYAVNMMYLAALSRQPTPAELSRTTRLILSSPDTTQVLQDIFWSLLNSNEFLLNH